MRWYLESFSVHISTYPAGFAMCGIAYDSQCRHCARDAPKACYTTEVDAALHSCSTSACLRTRVWSVYVHAYVCVWSGFVNEGFTGQQGDTGSTGESGRPGATGSVGGRGDTGLPGSVGRAGNTGMTGPVGPSGATGSTGPRGLKGDVGPVGPVGRVGVAGIVTVVFLEININYVD